MVRPWLARASRVQLLVTALVFAVAVFLCDTGLDFLMIRFDRSRSELLLVSDAVTALIAGSLMLWVLLVQRMRHLESQQRMQVIADMNHHVRNALQVISYWGMQEVDRNQLRLIAEAVERIEWALRDVLPRGVPHQGLRRPPASESDWPKRASND